MAHMKNKNRQNRKKEKQKQSHENIYTGQIWFSYWIYVQVIRPIHARSSTVCILLHNVLICLYPIVLIYYECFEHFWIVVPTFPSTRQVVAPILTSSGRHLEGVESWLARKSSTSCVPESHTTSLVMLLLSVSWMISASASLDTGSPVTVASSWDSVQSYITDICYFEFLSSLLCGWQNHFSHQFRAIYFLIKFVALGFFLSKDPPICSNSHGMLTKIEIRSSGSRFEHCSESLV